MADSLIYYKYRFEPKHIRYLFLLWFFNGLNNGGRKHSIGLGGNIKISMEEFMDRREDFCELGDQFNNGNGSLMRLAPIPIVFRESKEMAMKYSEQSSRTTHNGI
jgi:ADP-ribosyl-[dinitrogen reductase] hydrolase